VAALRDRLGGELAASRKAQNKALTLVLIAREELSPSA